ncbi:MAG: FAD-binding oxidoreductase, partial [Deltaproteobacteria bacterium]|nr:FAD-binding oxidoreductase [Deltaproteobacteria bacterium]
MKARRRSFWAWGFEDRLPSSEDQRGLLAMASPFFPGAELGPRELPEDSAVRMPEPRLATPDQLSEWTEQDPRTRALHTYGRAYRDIARGFEGDFGRAPDLVATPTTEDQLAATLEWCERERVAAVPFGGGTSVVGGVEVEELGDMRGVLTIDLGGFGGVREVDRRSLSARIGAGSMGPALEAELAEHGLTLRHYPQSFELSTLGGWLATRAGGHFATRYTHIDDLTQSIRMITPRGSWQSLRVPASGAGPSPDRWVLGSEGALGIITEAWMRIRPRPTRRAGATLKFAKLENAVDATRALAQSRLYPDNCRLLDSREALLHKVSMDMKHVLVLGFESAGDPVDSLIERAVELAQDHGGQLSGEIVHTDRTTVDSQRRSQEAGAWRSAFIDAPYLLNTAVSVGLIVDTFETACTWTAFPELRRKVIAAVNEVAGRECGGALVTMRFTHV